MAGFAIIKALLTRLLFAAFGVLCIWRVYFVHGAETFWLLMLAEVGLLIETLFTLIARKGKEWKWFSPCVLFYLACTVPAIWFLELDMLERRLADRPELQKACRNLTGNVTGYDTEDDDMDDDDTLSLHTIGINAEIRIENWVGGLEQVLVLLLVIGRWLLPRGDLTRDELSQLLLVYIAMAADIVELFEVFEEDRVGNNSRVVYTALALFTWSLLQFTIVFTAVRARKSRPGAIHAIDGTLPRGSQGFDGQEQPPLGGDGGHGDPVGQRRGTAQQIVVDGRLEKDQLICNCCHPDIFAMTTTIVMQDLPFLVFRLYLMFYERVLTQGVLFFVGKNTLVIALQIYRGVIICTEEKKKKKKNRAVERRELADVNVIMGDEVQQASRSEIESQSRFNHD